MESGGGTGVGVGVQMHRGYKCMTICLLYVYMCTDYVYLYIYSHFYASHLGFDYGYHNLTQLIYRMTLSLIPNMSVVTMHNAHLTA